MAISFLREIVISPLYWTFQPPLYRTESMFRSSLLARNRRRLENHIIADAETKTAAMAPLLDDIVLHHPRLELVIPGATQEHNRTLESVATHSDFSAGIPVTDGAAGFTLLRLLYRTHQSATPFLKNGRHFVFSSFSLLEVNANGDPVYLLLLNN